MAQKYVRQMCRRTKVDEDFSDDIGPAFNNGLLIMHTNVNEPKVGRQVKEFVANEQCNLFTSNRKSLIGFVQYMQKTVVDKHGENRRMSSLTPEEIADALGDSSSSTHFYDEDEEVWPGEEHVEQKRKSKQKNGAKRIRDVEKKNKGPNTHRIKIHPRRKRKAGGQQNA